MKRIMTVFRRETYASAADGVTQRYFHDKKLCPVLGQADMIRVHVVGHRQSAATARAKITVWESAWTAVRPAEAQKQLGAALVFTELRPDMLNINGPFSGLVELCLEIDDSAASADVQFELEVHVTLISS